MPFLSVFEHRDLGSNPWCLIN